jgi:hypothetical protein
MQVIAIEHGEAESMDGINWVLYVCHDDIVSHTGMSEIRYGSWSEHQGLKLSMVRGTDTSSIIEQVGGKLVDAVMKYSAEVPFRLNDRFECWLLTTDRRPLALIASADTEAGKRVFASPTWHPGVAAFDSFDSKHGDAKRLQQLINKRAGERAMTVWLKRKKTTQGYCGDGVTEAGETISATELPVSMLLQQWDDPNDSALVRDYTAWQAPWLLQLEHVDDATRVRLEELAWKRPILCAQQYRLFAKVIDMQQLKVTRVKARLMGYDSNGQSLVETFIETGDKETYSP